MTDNLSFIEAENGLHLTIRSHRISIFNTDLTQMKADAIVVPVNRSMDVETGITKIILSAAGKRVKRYKPILPEPLGKVVVLPPGELQAKYLFLTVVLGEKSHEMIKRAIQDATDRAIQYADFLKLDSIAFPLLGSAEVQPPFESVAHDMMEAVISHLKRRRTNLQTISFCVLNSTAFDAFRKEAKAIASK